MPLTSSVSQNVKDLYADNRKSSSARGDKGNPRSLKQIIAISYAAARKARGK